MQPSPTAGTKPAEIIPSLHGNFCHEYFSDMHDEIESLIFAEEVILDPCGHGKGKVEAERDLQCRECKVLTKGFVQDNKNLRVDVLSRLKSLKKGVCSDRGESLQLLFSVIKNYQSSYISGCGHPITAFKVKRTLGRTEDATSKISIVSKICEECKSQVEFYLPYRSLRKIVDILTRMQPFTNKPVYIHLHPYLAQQLDKVPTHHTKYMIMELLQVQTHLDIPSLNRVFDGYNNFIISGNFFKCDFDTRKEIFIFLFKNLEKLTEYQKFHLLSVAVNVIRENSKSIQNVRDVCSKLLDACRFVIEDKDWKSGHYDEIKKLHTILSN